MEKDMECRGGGMMKRCCSLTFEELLENVGTTSKEHHEIYNTLLLLLLLLSLENLVHPGVLFFSAGCFLLVLTFDIFPSQDGQTLRYLGSPRET